VSEVFYQDDGRKISFSEKHPLRGSGHYSRGSTVKFHPKDQPHNKKYMNSLRINPFNDYGENPVDLGERQNLEQVEAPVDFKRKNSNFELRINVNKRHQRHNNQNIENID
jgi:hypothetical protein